MLRECKLAQPSKTYSSYQNAEDAAKKIGEACEGAVTAFVHVTGAGRYYPIFCCFEKEHEIFSVARSGFIVHR